MLLREVEFFLLAIRPLLLAKSLVYLIDQVMLNEVKVFTYYPGARSTEFLHCGILEQDVDVNLALDEGINENIVNRVTLIINCIVKDGFKGYWIREFNIFSTRKLINVEYIGLESVSLLNDHHSVCVDLVT